MAATPSPEGPVTFDDVAVFFSEDEWNMLNDYQRALYMEVMKDNYEHFIFLGCEVPVILSLLQDRGNGGADSQPSSLNTPDGTEVVAPKKGPYKTAKQLILNQYIQQNGDESSHDENNMDESPPAHGRNLRKRRQYFCSECESCFRHSSALEAHRRVHNGDKPHQCDICNANFSYKSALIVHRRQHYHPSTSSFQNVENITPVEFIKPNRSPVPTPNGSPVLATNIPPASTGLVTVTPRPVQTNRILSESSGERGSPSLGEKPLKCAYCDKRFNDQSILEAHHRIHTGKQAYPCTMCDESFSKPSLLAAHNNTHKEGKPFQCDQCDKNFNDQSLLIAHKRTHTGEKPHKCSHCNKWFPNRTTLVVHEESHLKPKPYKCKHCEKSFNDKSLLTTHEGVHTDTKPFKCTQCSESFFLKTQLVSHQAIHAPDKPFPCSQCERSFNKKETLLAHIRVHNIQNIQTQKPRRQ
ncbi:zinc finger 852 isoform X1 [Pelobates cultripes]|uniref:Zinc finger 852 isoform X1 n=3 Tax=Pelobates cultripes TaxID=61616 RepID=A0AAD1W396_PELCU|nr:zinc finger 852 isoform X1 [Pelobates cultripes]